MNNKDVVHAKTLEQAQKWIARSRATTYGDKGLRLQMEEAQELLYRLIDHAQDIERVAVLEAMAHPPIELRPAIVEIVKELLETNYKIPLDTIKFIKDGKEVGKITNIEVPDMDGILDKCQDPNGCQDRHKCLMNRECLFHYGVAGAMSDMKNTPLKRNGSPTFYKLLEEIADIHNMKSHDYASNDNPYGNYLFAGMLSHLFNNSEDAGFIGRIGEKLYRLANLENGKKKVLNESIEDTERDIVAIIVLWIAMRRDRRNKI